MEMTVKEDEDSAQEIRYWASRHVDAEYIASTFGEYGLPTKESAMRDGDPGDPLYRIDITVVRVLDGDYSPTGEPDCA